MGMTGMTPAEMDEVLGRHFAAEGAQDVEGLLATLTDDAEHDVVGAGVLKGKEEIAGRYRELFATFKEEGIEPLRRLHGDDFLVDEIIWTARAIGDPFGIPGRNRVVSTRLMHVCEFRDGKMSREIVWMDVGAIMAQLAD